MASRVLTVLTALLLMTLGAGAAQAQQAEETLCFTCPIKVVPKGKTFEGTQIIPGSGGSAVPIGKATGGSSCPGCTYRLVPVCELGNGCRELGAEQCPDPEETRHAVFVTRPPAGEIGEGSVCLGPAEQPVPVEAITDAVERRLTDELIPGDADVVVQPAGGALVNVPTIVRADGARSPITETFFAAGFSVTVTAKPVRWTWTFGPGESDSFAYPGEPYASGVNPTTSGRHATWTYSRAGARQLQVVVTWEAQYALPGVGTVPVGSIERPSPAVPLQVYASRSELVAGS